MKEEKKIQVNVWMNKSWKDHLEKLARETSFKQDKNVNYHDLIREALINYFKFENEND